MEIATILFQKHPPMGIPFYPIFVMDWEDAVKNDLIKTSILRFGVVLSPKDRSS